jgi:NAD(P)-dependent dehydrogenase (short-subunit alcohol dehydrogenase family)
MAAELGPGVRVNAVSPAVVKTQFAKALYEARKMRWPPPIRSSG